MIKNVFKFAVTLIFGVITAECALAQDATETVSDEMLLYTKNVKKFGGTKNVEGSWYGLKGSDEDVNVIFDWSQMVLAGGGGTTNEIDAVEDSENAEEMEMGKTKFIETFFEYYNNNHAKKTGVKLVPGQMGCKYTIEIKPMSVYFNHNKKGGFMGSGAMLLMGGLIYLYEADNDKPLLVATFNRNWNWGAQMGNAGKGTKAVTEVYGGVAKQLANDISNGIKKAKAPKK